MSLIHSAAAVYLAAFSATAAGLLLRAHLIAAADRRSLQQRLAALDQPRPEGR